MLPPSLFFALLRADARFAAGCCCHVAAFAVIYAACRPLSAAFHFYASMFSYAILTFRRLCLLTPKDFHAAARRCC